MVSAKILSVVVFGVLTSSALAVPRVNVMPGTATDPKQYRPGTLVVWGNANGGDGSAIGFDYEFTFDPNPNLTGLVPVSGMVADDKFISTTLIVGLSGATRSNLVGHLKVTDMGTATSDTDTFVLDIVGPTDPISDTPAEALLVDVNNAINNGLRALYLMQAPNGSWSFYEGNGVGVTGFSVWAFENQGYFDSDDHDRDIYADFIGKGLDYLSGASGALVAFDPPVQPAGDPDCDGNNRAIQLSNSGVEGYSSPIATAALVSALATARPVLFGPAAGEPLKNVIQDSADYSVFGQNDDFTGFYRGGWRYFANIGSSDKSADSWNYVCLEGSEHVSLCCVPEFVKTEAEFWIVNDQNLDGRFGYAGPTPIGDGVGHATTGAGVAGLAFLTAGGRIPTFPGADPSLDTYAEKLAAALAHLGANWGSGGPPSFLAGNRGNLYAMWTITRGLRLNGIETLDNGGSPFDWELNITAPDAAAEGYFPFLVRTQNPTGSWDLPDGFYNEPFDTALAELILSPFVFATSCDPITINFDLSVDGRLIPTQTRVDDEYLSVGCHMEGKSGDTGFIGTYATNPALDPSTDDLFATSPLNVVNTRPSAARTDSDWGTITFFFQDESGAVRSAREVSVDFLDVEDSGFGGGGRNKTKLTAYDSTNAVVGEVLVPVGPNGNQFNAHIGGADRDDLFITKVIVTLGDKDDSAAMDTFRYCLNPPSLDLSITPKDGLSTIDVAAFVPVNKKFNIGKHYNGKGLLSPEESTDYELKITAKVKGRSKVYTLLRQDLHMGTTPSDRVDLFNFIGPTLHRPEIVDRFNGREVQFEVTAQKLGGRKIVSYDSQKLRINAQ